jgi:hypothetical protein
MSDYIFFMHDDARDGANDWEPYLTRLKARALSRVVARLAMVSASEKAERCRR